jgi:hypothetical protein
LALYLVFFIYQFYLLTNNQRLTLEHLLDFGTYGVLHLLLQVALYLAKLLDKAVDLLYDSDEMLPGGLHLI